MGVIEDDGAIKQFEDWYKDREEDPNTGALKFRGISEFGDYLHQRYTRFKTEMDGRCGNYDKLLKMADGEVISPKPDLPNVSSGDTAGLVRRMARNMVQHAPNVSIVSKFDDDSVNGIFATYILRSKIVGEDEYSNDMQQNLFSSTKLALTIGFDCVVPCLLQKPDGSWYIKYDTIHYRDVFPEPGAKDVRQATEVFVRRYLTKGEIKAIIREQAQGWDIAALKALLISQPMPPNREQQSNPHQDTKRHRTAEGYEIVTWYSSTGQPFLTYSPTTKMLFRVENNLHPLKEHPVHFLVLEKDDQQPLGKSQVELVLGRQEFQDLMLNGAMKLWYRNINPSIMGYGAVGAIPNLSPGKYNQISNPNAKVEPFEVNTQTLMQYQVITQGNLGSMVNLVGSADQQMAQSAGGGMSATPQGVEAQTAMVDITTNNYQKAIESFFSHYCSYALTIYFAELKTIKKVTPSADARLQLINAGLKPTDFDDKGELHIDFEDLNTEYFVKCIPGSLVELEDEKQLRILNQLFIPLSQAMPAIAQSGNPQMLANAAQVMQYIIEKEIELSGSNRSKDIKSIFQTGRTEEFNEYERRAQGLEEEIGGVAGAAVEGIEHAATAVTAMQAQMKEMGQILDLVLDKMGVPKPESTVQPNSSEQQAAPVVAGAVNV